MTSEQVYKSFLIKTTKNDTNSNVAVPKGLFIKLYNEQAQIWLDNQIKILTTSDEKNSILELLVYDKSLIKDSISQNFVSFKLPVDFFSHESSYSIANKGDCKNRTLLNWDFKVRNRNSYTQDTNMNPSFEYEETIINLSENKLLVFKTDFDILEEYLTYYRLPVAIDIEGYIKEDGSQSKNVHPDVTDFNVNRILNLCAVETMRIFENPESYKWAQERL